MIHSVKVTNHVGESLTIELRNPERTGFLIKDITGLGPCKADISAKELATMDGSVVTSSRVNSRNIVIKMNYLSNPTIEDTRQKSYKYFPVKKQVTLEFETDNRVCRTVGYVESNEPNIFSANEDTQISIICPDPFFYSAGDLGVTVTMFYGVEDNFEFPFSNESLGENLIEVGIATYSKERIICYTGDAEIGITMTIYATGTVHNITVYNVRTREFIKLDTNKLKILTGQGLEQGDKVIISTVKGDKYATLIRAGEETNILNCIDRTSTWMQLQTGDNMIAYTADDGASNLEFKIENRTLYEGV